MKILITEDQYNLLKEGYVNLPVEEGVRLELWEDKNKLTLDTIIIPKEYRGQGMGTKIMNMVCEYSDNVNKPLFLTPSSSYGVSSLNRLISFYKRFGFKKNVKFRDISIHYMVRLPNK